MFVIFCLFFVVLIVLFCFVCLFVFVFVIFLFLFFWGGLLFCLFCFNFLLGWVGLLIAHGLFLLVPRLVLCLFVYCFWFHIMFYILDHAFGRHFVSKKSWACKTSYQN